MILRSQKPHDIPPSISICMTSCCVPLQRLTSPTPMAQWSTDPIASLINRQFSDTNSIIPFKGNLTLPLCTQSLLWGSKILLRSFSLSVSWFPCANGLVSHIQRTPFKSTILFSGHASGGLRNLPLTKQRFSLEVN